MNKTAKLIKPFKGYEIFQNGKKVQTLNRRNPKKWELRDNKGKLIDSDKDQNTIKTRNQIK